MRIKVAKTDGVVLLGIFIWGIVFPIIKYSLREIDPLAFATARILMGTLALLALVWLGERKFAVRREEWTRVVWVAITSITLYQIFFTLGIGRTTASNSSLLIATSPIFTLLFAALLREERVTPFQIGGVFLSFLGVSMVVGAGQGELSLGSDSLTGDLLTVMAAVVNGLSVVLARRPLSRHSVLQMTAIFNAIGALALLPVGVVPIMRQPWGEISTAAWLGLGYAAFLSTTVGYICWYKGIVDLGPTRTMAYSYLVPVIAVVTAILTLGERFTALQGVGALVIFVGIALVRLAPQEALTMADREKVHQYEEGGYHGK